MKTFRHDKQETDNGGRDDETTSLRSVSPHHSCFLKDMIYYDTGNITAMLLSK